MQMLARAKVPLPLPSLQWRFARDTPFCRFLSEISPGWIAPLGGLAALAGNPQASGRRYILLLFQDEVPVAVVKAGASAEARDLVRREAAFLEAARRAGIEGPAAVFESERIAAFAMRHLIGAPPQPEDRAKICETLEGWVDAHATLPVAELPAWRRLSAACTGEAGFEQIHAAIGASQVQPALMHGDFAPWNIKVHPETGAWQLIDWERAEMQGIPGWDWLHFEIQTSILVRGESVYATVSRLEQLFCSQEFRAYAERARIAGLERSLTIAYLLNCRAGYRQTEGRTQIDALLRHASAQWNV